MPHTSDAELIQHTHNTARYFVEHRQIAWAALIGVIGWGVYGYFAMPQRKDPEIPVRVAVAACQWPGATAQQVEQLITRPIEETIAQNKTIHPAGPDDYGIRSISLPGASFVYVQLSEDTKNSREQFSDINLKLQGLGPQLPAGASGVEFQSDFGDTAALMMTVASPPVDDLEIEMRARSVEDAIRAARSAALRSTLQAVSIIYTFPLALSETAMTQATEGFRRSAERDGVIEGGKLVAGRGFIGVDGATKYDDKDLAGYLQQYITLNFHESEFDPDISARVIIRDVKDTRAKLAAAGGLKYSYAQLDNFTDLISRSLLGVAQTSRVERKGVLPQAVYLEYSQQRLASYGLQAADLGRVLLARNITLPGGSIEAGAREIHIDPSGQFEDARSIGNVIVGASNAGSPIYLRDMVQISRAYQSPASYLNFYSWVDKDGQPHRSRAITLAVYMRSGEQIQKFGVAIEEKMKQVRGALPSDLVIARTSDQPLQVKENIDLFMEAL
jgi:multidrug efflux pump subunit AcrB